MRNGHIPRGRGGVRVGICCWDWWWLGVRTGPHPSEEGRGRQWGGAKRFEEMVVGVVGIIAVVRCGHHR